MSRFTIYMTVTVTFVLGVVFTSPGGPLHLYGGAW